MLTKKTEKKSIQSICAQADHPAKDPYGSHVVPLYQTSTFRFKTVEDGKKYFAHESGGASHSYSRLGNPTVEQLERVLAKLEGLNSDDKTEAMVFGSGMAAISTGIIALAAGKRVLAQEALYGCTSQFLQEDAPKLGIEVTNINPNNLDEIREKLKLYPDTSLIYLESVANPTMRICDVEAIAKLAHEAGVYVMVDNTFATPYHMQPLSLGADIVAHSTTKYLCGHGTIIGGALMARKELFESVNMSVYRKNMGGIAGPFDAWLTLMGIKTFPLRMAKHSENAGDIAEYLEHHPAVSRVWYPGLPHHPDHDIGRRLMKNGFGGVIAFELNGGYEAGVEMMNHVQLCTLAVSLGTVDSLIQHPASMTHSVVKPEIRKKTGISDGLIRLSVGIESVEDIILDLEQALQY